MKTCFKRQTAGLAPAVLACVAVTVAAGAQEKTFDIGAAGDERYVVEGFYPPEGPIAHSKMAYAKANDFRWAKPDFALRLPVFPNEENEVTIEGGVLRPTRFSTDAGWSVEARPDPDDRHRMTFTISGAVVGTDREILIRGRNIHPLPVSNRKDKRELFLLIGKIAVRPLPPVEETDVTGGRGYRLDIGAEGDMRWVQGGFERAEGPHPQAVDPLYRDNTLRWATNEYRLALPVYPGRENHLRIEGRARTMNELTVGDWTSRVDRRKPGDPPYELTIPASAIGPRKRVFLEGRAVEPVEPSGEKAKRVLNMTYATIEIRPGKPGEAKGFRMK